VDPVTITGSGLIIINELRDGGFVGSLVSKAGFNYKTGTQTVWLADQGLVSARSLSLA
jgi:hypothetical protein